MKRAAEPKCPKLRVMHYSLRTEKQYVQWIIRFILFHNKHHPEQMQAKNFIRFLTHLAETASTATGNKARFCRAAGE